LPPCAPAPATPTLHLALFSAGAALLQPLRQPTVLTAFFQFAASTLPGKTKRFLSPARLPIPPRPHAQGRQRGRV
jgi:hypothetical protein